MDFASAWQQLNWLAVLGATVSAFVVGGLWYGPLFGRAWMAQWNFTDEDLKTRNMGLIFGGSFALSFVIALVLALFVGPAATWSTGLIAALAAGIGWVAPFLGILALFESRSMAAFAIDAGYCVVALAVMGVLLGAF